VLIYAPGSTSSAYENADLCEYLASHGYLVLASPSLGVTTRSMTLNLEGAEAQARDISFLVGYATTLAQADKAKITVIGYSFGGLANVLAAAQDDRIGALVALDGSVRYYPAIAQAATYATPERLAVPLLYNRRWPQTKLAIGDAAMPVPPAVAGLISRHPAYAKPGASAHLVAVPGQTLRQ
jgi:dienelactone hydrolase